MVPTVGALEATLRSAVRGSFRWRVAYGSFRPWTNLIVPGKTKPGNVRTPAVRLVVTV